MVDLLKATQDLLSAEAVIDKIPDEVLSALEAIFKHNDAFNSCSSRRVTLAQAADHLAKYGYVYGRNALIKIARQNFGRRGWGHA